MISDRLSNAALYRGVHPRLERALAAIASFDLSQPDGRYEIDGEDLYLLAQRYDTAATPTKRWESHRRYYDVQYVVSGLEVIHHRHIEGLGGAKPYDPAKDVIIYEQSPDGPGLVCLWPGEFAVFFPEDGHRPGGALEETGNVRKLVAKVRL